MLAFLESLLLSIPLELYAIIGSFLEEIVAPIPSPFIMTTAGGAAVKQGYTWLGLLIIALLGAVGKTAASVVLYVVADRSEDIVLGKFGKFLGLSHTQIERIGQLLSKGWWDDVVLLLLRVVPILPTFMISIACGVLKVNMRTFITTTYIGSVVRNLFFLGIGVYGANFLPDIQAVIVEQSWTVLIAVTVLVVGGIVLLYKSRNKLTTLLHDTLTTDKDA